MREALDEYLKAADEYQKNNELFHAAVLYEQISNISEKPIGDRSENKSIVDGYIAVQYLEAACSIYKKLHINEKALELSLKIINFFIEKKRFKEAYEFAISLELQEKEKIMLNKELVIKAIKNKISGNNELIKKIIKTVVDGYLNSKDIKINQEINNFIVELSALSNDFHCHALEIINS